MLFRTLALIVALAAAPALEAAPAAKKPAASAKKPSGKKAKAKAKPAAKKPPVPRSQVAGHEASPGMQAAQLARAKAQAGDAAALAAVAAVKAAGGQAASSADLLARSPAEDWREPDPNNLVWMEFKLPSQPAGAAPVQVLMELAPRFAPEHAANIRALVRGGYFDGLSVLRVQDNFVTQWGDPAEDKNARALPASAKAKLPAEFDAPLAGLPLTALAEDDGWAPLSGFVDGFAVAADPAKTAQGRAWLPHCYGVVGAGRSNEIDSSNGSSLYAIIGQPARSLDLNITVVGRVLKGIEHLAALERGGANMGFYEGQQAKPPLVRARLAADLPEAERPSVKVLRTDTTTWNELLHSRRYRGGWFVHSPGRVDLCSTQVPVRVTSPKPATPTTP
jgi:cyclophilin family peptidyl-prolyl cis-trans isomerase